MYTLAQLQSVACQLVRFKYVSQTDKKGPRNYTQRSGTTPDMIQGRAGTPWNSKKGEAVITVRNQNQQVPGDRKGISDTLLKIAMESEKEFHGLPGEYLPITCQGRGMRDLEVMRGNKWVKVSPSLHWVIDVSSWGTLYGIGTEKQAEEWRKHKANWEKSVAKKRLATAEEIEGTTFEELASLIGS